MAYLLKIVTAAALLSACAASSDAKAQESQSQFQPNPTLVQMQQMGGIPDATSPTGIARPPMGGQMPPMGGRMPPMFGQMPPPMPGQQQPMPPMGPPADLSSEGEDPSAQPKAKGKSAWPYTASPYPD